MKTKHLKANKIKVHLNRMKYWLVVLVKKIEKTEELYIHAELFKFKDVSKKKSRKMHFSGIQFFFQKLF